MPEELKVLKGRVYVQFHGDEMCWDFDCTRPHEMRPLIMVEETL